MFPPLIRSAARALLLAALMTTFLVACGPDPAARDPAAGDSEGRKPAAQGTWARWNAYGDEISYLNTQYVSEGPPIVAETLNIWRPEPAFTYRIRTRRAFWCKEEEVALLERWTSKNGGPFEKREISEERGRRRSIREFDSGSSTLSSPPNQIASLLNKVCNRYFGDRVADPMADFESSTKKSRDRQRRRKQQS